MARRTVSGSPRRRTYVTGETAPELSDSFRPIPLGLDENGDSDEQIRAFAVNIRNLSDNAVYVKEGREGDAAVIDRFGNYTIWETNGISSIDIRGETGGESVELRVLEAHNDFGIRDKIDAFVRAISHFFTSNKQETVITEADTVLPVEGDVSVTNDTLNVSGDVTAQVNGGTITVDNDALNVTGDVGINTTSENAEITTELVDSTVQQDVNIESASVGDISVADRTAKTTVLGLRYRNQAVDGNGNPNIVLSYLFQNATFDGYIQNYTVRHYADPQEYNSTGSGFPALDLVAVAPEIDDGEGFSPAVNRDYLSARQIRTNAADSAEVKLLRYDSSFETVYRVEPNQKIEFQEGDGLRFLVGAFSMTDDFDGQTTYVPGGMSQTDRWITEVTLTIGQIEQSTHIGDTA